MDSINVLEGSVADSAIEQLKSVVTLSPGEEGSPKVALLKQDDYQAIPVKHSGKLTPEIAQTIFDAAKATGVSSMTAIGLYSPDEQHCYSLPMTADGISDLRGTSCGVINFALFGGSPGWLILFHNQLYIAYGPAAFINAIAGSAEAAITTFQTEINELKAQAEGDVPGYIVQEVNRVTGYYSAVLTNLSEGYANAGAGDMVSVV